MQTVVYQQNSMHQPVEARHLIPQQSPVFRLSKATWLSKIISQMVWFPLVCLPESLRIPPIPLLPGVPWDDPSTMNLRVPVGGGVQWLLRILTYGTFSHRQNEQNKARYKTAKEKSMDKASNPELTEIPSQVNTNHWEQVAMPQCNKPPAAPSANTTSSLKIIDTTQDWISFIMSPINFVSFHDNQNSAHTHAPHHHR